MRTTAAVVIGVLSLCIAATAQPAKTTPAADEAALRAIEEKWDAANIKGDVAALTSLFADGFISTDSEGKTKTKAEVLAGIKAGEVKYQTSKVEDMKVYLYGDAAVVNGRWTGKFVEKGQPKNTVERFTDVYVRQNGQWKCVATHGSAIK